MKIKHLFLLTLFTAVVFSCSKDDEEFVPAELMGSWQAENSAGCYETFIFSSNHLNWKQYCPLVNARDDVSYPISGEEPSRNALKTSNGYWFLYHLYSSTSMSVRRYDGDTDLSTIPEDWYKTRGITVTKVQ